MTYTIYAANNKEANQTARMRRLTAALLLAYGKNRFFSMTWLIIMLILPVKNTKFKNPSKLLLYDITFYSKLKSHVGHLTAIECVKVGRRCRHKCFLITK